MSNKLLSTLRSLETGDSTARSLLAVVEESAARFADFNALCFADWTHAKRQADALDEAARAGHRKGPLHGAPLSIKDLFGVKGMPMKAGCRAALPAHLPAQGEFDSAPAKAWRDAGALLFCKTNMHEIALGITGENTWTGDVKNALDPAYQAGGSSSGAATATALGMGLAGMGSDTGGSIRIPAAYAGLVGFKPSFAAVSLAGALHLSWSFDHAGPLAHSVADARLLTEVLANRSLKHGQVGRVPRFGVPRQWLSTRLSESVRAAFEASLLQLKGSGAELVDVDVPSLPRVWDFYPIISRSEAAFVHEKTLAQDRGGPLDENLGLTTMTLESLREGRQFSAQEYFAAQKLRQEITQALETSLAEVDAWLVPSSGIATPKRGQKDGLLHGPGGASRVVTLREAVIFLTMPFSACGQPVVNLPYRSDLRFDNGVEMPLGLQVIGRTGSDASLFALAQWVESTIAS